MHYFLLSFSCVKYLLCIASESKPAYEQQRTRVLCAGDSAECGVAGGQRRAEAGELRMVEGIMRIDTESECHALPQRNISHKADVPYVLTRPIESRAWRGTQSILRRHYEGIGVEPLRYGALRVWDVGISHLGYVLPSRVDLEPISLRDIVRIPHLELGDGTGLPMPDDLRKNRSIREESASRPHRQSIDRRGERTAEECSSSPFPTARADCIRSGCRQRLHVKDRRRRPACGPRYKRHAQKCHCSSGGSM